MVAEICLNLSLRPLVFHTHGNPFGTNSVWLLLPMLQICLISIYIPPLSATKYSAEVIKFISDNLDEVLLIYPNFDIQLIGDFNRIDTNYLECSFDIRNVLVNEPTRGNAMLDLVFLSTDLLHLYEISVGPPVSSSDHRSVLCKPVKNMHQQP